MIACHSYSNIAIKSEKRTYLHFKFRNSDLKDTWTDSKRMNFIDKNITKIPDDVINFLSTQFNKLATIILKT